MSISLRGITWDHERGYDPLVAVSELFCSQDSSCSIHWQKRSLKDFGDYPLEKLIPDYDLVMLDHPFTGEALVENLLLPLNKLLSKEHLELQKKESLGSCFESYVQGSKIMALPVDAAALVSAAQEGFLNKDNVPTNWEELQKLCRKLGKTAVAIPLCPVDMWCVYLSLCAQCGNKKMDENFFAENGIAEETSIEAIELLYELVSYLNPHSFSMNPISLFNEMSTGKSAILYTPFAFGYTNYSRDGYREKLLEFFDAPTIHPTSYSAILGGVGIGISSCSKHIHKAAEFIQLLTSTEIQCGLFTQTGGQPAHKSAWVSESNNELCRNFFSNTKSTLEHAYVRPRCPKFNLFQEQASICLHRSIQKNEKTRVITTQLNELFCKVIEGN